MNNLSIWAQPQLERFLPLDEQSVQEIVTYSTSISKEAAAEHLKNLLGDSPQALEFISSFNARRPNAVASDVPDPSLNRDSALVSQNGSEVTASRKRNSKKARTPLHAAGPVRRPENYGNISTGYTKSSAEQDYIPQARRPISNASSTGPSPSEAPDALQTPVPAAPSKLPPSAAGSLISDLPNVKSRTSKKSAQNSGASTPHKATITSSLGDLTAAIAALELSTNPSLSSERRNCDCNASIHPLFETAPNCLSCGKIICALEGLQPCSFCDSPILSKEQVQTMIQALKEERGQERMAVHNAAASRSGRGSPVFRSGGETPESSGDEASSAAARARAHRDKLLSFQRENAKRTRIHDEAADYDMGVTSGATQWMSPVQRAAALKKQQKYLRELEEANKPEWEKRKTVMSMSIQNGKLVRTYETAQREAPAEIPGKEDMGGQDEDDDSGQVQPNGRLSDNPLLSGGGLIRPIWRRPDGWIDKGKGREEARPPSAWRRVQDDQDDNEQWILDGGVNGLSDTSK